MSNTDLLNKIKTNAHVLAQIPVQDESFYEKAVEIQPKCLRHIPPEFQSDFVVITALAKSIGEFRYLTNPSEFVIEYVLGRCGKMLRWIKNPTAYYCELAFENDVSSFRWIPHHLQTRDMCKIAVEKYLDALLYVDPQYIDEDLYERAVKFSSYTLKHIPRAAHTEKLILLAVNYKLDNLNQNTVHAKYLISQYRRVAGNILKYVANTRENILAVLSVNGLIIQKLENPTDEMCMRALKTTIRAYRHIRAFTLPMVQFCVENDCPQVLELIGPELRTREIYNQMLDLNCRCLQYIPEEFQEHDRCLRAVQSDPPLLQYVVHQTREICLAAIAACSYCTIKYEWIKIVDDEVYLALVKKMPHLFLQIENPSDAVCEAVLSVKGILIRHIKNPTEAMCLIAVTENYTALSHIENPSYSVCATAMACDIRAIQFVPNATYEHWLSALRLQGWLIEYMPTHLQTLDCCIIASYDKYSNLQKFQYQNSEICERLVRADYRNLQWVNDQTTEICEIAIDMSSQALEWVKIKTRDLCMRALRRSNNIFHVIPEQFHDEEMYLLAIKTSRDICRHILNWTQKIADAYVAKDYESSLISYIPVQFQTESMCINSLQKNRYVLQYIAVQTPEISRQAIITKQLYLNLITNWTPDLVDLAIRTNYTNIKHIPNLTLDNCLLAMSLCDNENIEQLLTYITDDEIRRYCQKLHFAGTRSSRTKASIL